MSGKVWQGKPAHYPGATAQFIRADWMVDAACRNHDPEMWFPERGADSSEAVAICLTCPVIAECLDYAITRESLLPGIWGGTSARERRVLRREFQLRRQ